MDRGAVVVGANQRAVVHRSPHRLVHAIALPERAVGEADLPAHGLPTSGKPVLVQLARRGIAVRGREARISLAERSHDLRTAMNLYQFVAEHAGILALPA